jgi:hypothetical protein
LPGGNLTGGYAYAGSENEHVVTCVPDASVLTQGRAPSLAFSCDPTGNRRGSKRHRTPPVTFVSTAGAAPERLGVTFGCSECNEALDAARGALRTARRLVLVAENALTNGDLFRARAALADLQDGFLESETPVTSRTENALVVRRPSQR